MVQSHCRQLGFIFIITVLIIVMSLNAGFALAQISDISYTLTPVVEGVKFDDDAALDNALLFGGKVGFGFGEFIELSGIYLFGSTLKTDFSNLSGFDAPARGFGESRPIADNGSPTGRAMNRRVEFVVVKTASAAETR